MPPQLSEEGHRVVRLDVLIVCKGAEVEVALFPFRADCDGALSGDALPPVLGRKDGRFAARRERAPSRGHEHKAGLVEENEWAPLREDFFMRGHSLRFQRLISVSSRSRARGDGFWQLQPRRFFTTRSAWSSV